MSWEMVNLVLNADLPPGHKLIMLGVANHTNPEGKGCWAAVERFEWNFGYKERQVQRILKSLEEAGYIRKSGVSEYGTNVWDIQVKNIPALPPFNEWKKQRRREKALQKQQKKATQAATAPQEVAPVVEEIVEEAVEEVAHQGDGGGCHNDTLLGCHYGGEGVSFTTENASQMTPEPVVKPVIKNHRIQAADAADAAGSSDSEDPWDIFTAPTTAPNGKDYLSSNRDNEYLRYGVDEEDDPKGKGLPETPLQEAIVKAAGAKYLTSSMKKRLKDKIKVVDLNKKETVTHPSPESEWRRNPELFEKYVDLCVQLAKRYSRPGHNVDRTSVISYILKYDRPKTGWIDFQNLERQFRANMEVARKQYYYDESLPGWLR